ncbi:juvenile hormone epoxide hydrolase-like [Maniola jurtina]|uniref:juvenile hormone epoxide hydrolase-like n=1 Tax=Maniola jurtina TaxID=191418 RepID=UPI001E68AF90|nr:juvenile hormone epoxide hydrolase-like [Maniola jurtina]
MIKDLIYRLKNHRKFVPPLEGIAFEYGFNTNQIDPWVKYWTEEYNFKQRETFFNQFPHYKTNIQGLDIHFISVKPQTPAGIYTVPLLILHDWASSFREFYDAIPLFTTSTEGCDFVFEPIVPSLPGFGFSDAAVRPGLGPAQMGVILNNLMRRLGHKKYYLQGGGGWGSIIAITMVTLFQKEILGFHTNLHLLLNSCSEIQTLAGVMSAAQGAPGSEIFATIIEETGYLHLQATKPDSLGVGLTDSPVGLLVYILEKFSVFTRVENRYLPDGGLYNDYTRVELVDNLMVYWTTGTITTSMRLFAEAFSKKQWNLRINELPTSVPFWALQANNTFLAQPINPLKFHNIVGVTTLDDGGNFLAFELPQAYVADVFRAVKAFIEFRIIRCEL